MYMLTLHIYIYICREREREHGIRLSTRFAHARTGCICYCMSVVLHLQTCYNSIKYNSQRREAGAY